MSDEDNRSLQAMEFQTGSVCFYATRNGATITLRVCNLSPHSERIISVPFLAEKMGGRCSMATLEEFVHFLQSEVLDGLPKGSQDPKPKAQGNPMLRQRESFAYVVPNEGPGRASNAGSDRQFIRPALRAFAQDMEARLRANDHKSGWLHDHDPHLLKRLEKNLAKLTRALEDAALLKQNGCHEAISREAADVANFAMMLADRWRPREPLRPMAEVHDRLPPQAARLPCRPELDNRAGDTAEDENGGEP